MTVAESQNIGIARGFKFEMTATVTDKSGAIVTLTGWSAKLDIFKDGATTAVDTFTSPSGGLTIAGVSGQVLVDIASARTAAFTWETGSYKLSVKNDPGDGEPYLVLRGKVLVS